MSTAENHLCEKCDAVLVELSHHCRRLQFEINRLKELTAHGPFQLVEDFLRHGAFQIDKPVLVQLEWTDPAGSRPPVIHYDVQMYSSRLHRWIGPREGKVIRVATIHLPDVT